MKKKCVPGQRPPIIPQQSWIMGKWYWVVLIGLEAVDIVLHIIKGAK